MNKNKTGIIIILRSPALRGGLIFISLLILFCIILYPVSVREHVTKPFTSFIALQAAWLIKFIGITVYSHGASITGKGFSVEIKNGCNAIYEISLFISAVIAYPSSLKYKFFGLAVGATVIYIFNLLRVIILFIIGVYYQGFFKMVHDHISQNIFIFFVVILWVFWASAAGNRISTK